MKAAFLLALVYVSSTEGFSGRLQQKSFKSTGVLSNYLIFVQQISISTFRRQCQWRLQRCLCPWSSISSMGLSWWWCWWWWLSDGLLWGQSHWWLPWHCLWCIGRIKQFPDLSWCRSSHHPNSWRWPDMLVSQCCCHWPVVHGQLLQSWGLLLPLRLLRLQLWRGGSRLPT